jgi:hypothetical protein
MEFSPLPPSEAGSWLPAPTHVHVGLDEDRIREEQPLARAQLLAELKDLSTWAKEQVQISTDLGKPDPRYAQIHLACIRERGRLLRLTEAPKPVEPPAPEPTQERDRIRALVLGQLAELEHRAQNGGASQQIALNGRITGS